MQSLLLHVRTSVPGTVGDTRRTTENGAGFCSRLLIHRVKSTLSVVETRRTLAWYNDWTSAERENSDVQQMETQVQETKNSRSDIRKEKATSIDYHEKE
jgi:hypothetical protein